MSGRFVDGPEQRQTAIAEVIAGRAIVHEPDDLIAELAVLDDLVRDQTTQLAGSGDQNPLQPDAGAPAALEHIAHELARSVGGRGVQDEEDAPHHLRDLEDAAGPEGRWRSRSARRGWRRCRRPPRECCPRTRRRNRRRATVRGAAGTGPAAETPAVRARRRRAGRRDSSRAAACPW